MFVAVASTYARPQVPHMPVVSPNGDVAADIGGPLIATPCTMGVPNEAVVLTDLKRHQIG